MAPLGSAGPAPLRFHVAPLQCYTDAHLRFFLRCLSSSATLWTEMEKVDDLLISGSALERRLRHDEQGPLVLQLAGDDPSRLVRAAHKALPYAFSEINLNCGCPAVTSGGADYGAALMLRPHHTADLVSALAEACPETPVSVKCRLAVHSTLEPDGTLPNDDYDAFAQFVDRMASAGAAHVVVHARAAVLSGLSVGKNRSVPPLRPEWVWQLANDLSSRWPNLRLTLNGGINSIAALRTVDKKNRERKAAPLDGAMAGRWLLRRPLDAWAIDHLGRGSNAEDGGGAAASTRRGALNFWYRFVRG